MHFCEGLERLLRNRHCTGIFELFSMTPQTDAEMGEVPSGSMESVPSMTDKAGPSTEPKLLTDRPLTLQKGESVASVDSI